MRRTIVMMAAAAVMAVAAPAFAATGHMAGHSHGKTASLKKTELKCPVMGGKIIDTKTAPKSVYKGKTYYFCCPECKPKFDKNPGKYIKAEQKAAVVCPVTGDKVQDTKKAAKSAYKGKTYYFCCADCKPKFDKNPGKYVKKAAPRK